MSDTQHQSPRVLSLCSGIGGIDLAAEWAGMEIVGQVEIDPFCCAVLAHHWPDVRRLGDIREVIGDEFGSVDLVVGGIPCQPFSVAGARRGTADDRHLWPEMLRIIERCQPAVVLVENVAGFVSMVLDDVSADLERRGYETRAFVLPAAAVGAPHLRERVFLVGDTRHAQRAGRDASAVRGAGGTGTGQSPRDESAPYGSDVAHAQYDGFTASTRQRATTGVEQQSGWTPEPHGTEQSAGGSARSRVHAGLADTAGGARCEAAQRNRGLAVASDAPVEYASGTGREERHPSRVASDTGNATGRHHSAGQHGQAQSGVGGAVDGLPGWLDGVADYCWPSGPGQAQHEWEAPRTTTGKVVNRAARLKALGNAVVPQQVYPILAAIAATWGESEVAE